MPRRRSPSLSDPRSALRTRGDIAVGAYAARQRRIRALVALFGFALIGTAVWLYFALNPDVGVQHGWDRQVAVECVKCGWRGMTAAPAGAIAFPLECPECGEHACHRLWECRECGHRFLSKGQGPVLRCPECGSKAVGAALAAHSVSVQSVPAEESQGSDPNGR